MLLPVMLITVSVVVVVVVVAAATAVNAFVGTGRQPRVNYGKNFKLQKIATMQFCQGREGNERRVRGGEGRGKFIKRNRN